MEKKKQRVVFTFDSRSLSNLQDLTKEGEFSSMAEAVRESLAINRALQDQAKDGYTEVVLRDPKTGKEKTMVFPRIPRPSRD